MRAFSSMDLQTDREHAAQRTALRQRDGLLQMFGGFIEHVAAQPILSQDAVRPAAKTIADRRVIEDLTGNFDGAFRRLTTLGQRGHEMRPRDEDDVWLAQPFADL